MGRHAFAEQPLKLFGQQVRRGDAVGPDDAVPGQVHSVFSEHPPHKPRGGQTGKRCHIAVGGHFSGRNRRNDAAHSFVSLFIHISTVAQQVASAERTLLRGRIKGVEMTSSEGGRSSVLRVLVLLNPGAGRRAVLQAAREHIEARGSDLDLVVPDPSDQKAQLSEAEAAVRQGVDAVVVCGGDGMVGLGVNLVAQQEIPLGIVPTGSGNDFARAADIPRRHADALHRVLLALQQPELPARRVDALRLRIEGDGADVLWVANSVNIGFDAQVNQRANAQRRVPRQVRYLVALAREVPRFRAVEFELRLDSEPAVRQQSSLVCIQNGSSIGGGIPLAPGARIDDGWAEVSHVAPLSRPGLVALMPLLMLRMHRWLKPLTARRIRHIRIGVPAEVPICADGDELHPGRSSAAEGLVVEVELVPGALLILD